MVPVELPRTAILAVGPSGSRDGSDLPIAKSVRRSGGPAESTWTIPIVTVACGDQIPATRRSCATSAPPRTFVDIDKIEQHVLNKIMVPDRQPCADSS